MGRERFWKDKWCGVASLCDSFPALFAIATSKQALVKDVWSASKSEERGERGGVGALASLGLLMIGK